MACYNPRLMRARVDPDTGALSYVFMGSALYADPSQFGTMDDLSTRGYYDMIIPCGKCQYCLADRAREWSNRMVLELQDYPRALFVTLTYNDDHLKYTDSRLPNLSIEDCQLFFKRLRKHFEPRVIRYAISGEYGPKTHRPHYHAIIYNIGMSDFANVSAVGYNERKDVYYTSPELEKIWENGFVSFAPVSALTCGYVARYTFKKQVNRNEDITDDRQKEFFITSRRPGIGLARADMLLHSGMTKFTYGTPSGMVSFNLPKSAIKSLKNRNDSDFAFFAELCYNRSKQASEALLSQLTFSGQTFYDHVVASRAKLNKSLALLPDRREL